MSTALQKPASDEQSVEERAVYGACVTTMILVSRSPSAMWLPMYACHPPNFAPFLTFFRCVRSSTCRLPGYRIFAAIHVWID